MLNGQDDYSRSRNYWKYLKAKLKKEGNEVVSGTNQLKLHAPDGKMRLTDVLDAAGVVELAKNMPNNKASKFIEWFIYGEDTIDGKSKAKAYTLFESSLLESIEVGTVKGLQQIHGYLSAMEKSVADSSAIKALLKDALTDKVNDREMYMKGIDYSYYYEEA